MTKNTGMGDSRAPGKSRAQKHKMTMWLNPAECYCRDCGRQFGKMRALCGHMGAHKDRSWRGLLPPPVHHHPRRRRRSYPRRRPLTYEASTSTGMRGGPCFSKINFLTEPQENDLASPKLWDMLAPEPQEKVLLAPESQEKVLLASTILEAPQDKDPVSPKLETQAAQEPQEKIPASPKIDLNVAPVPEPPEAVLDSHEKFNFDLNEAPEEDGANDY